MLRLLLSPKTNLRCRRCQDKTKIVLNYHGRCLLLYMDFLTIENDTVAIITQFSDTYLIYGDTTYFQGQGEQL